MASVTGEARHPARRALCTGDRLPPLVLPEAGGRGEVAWRAPSRGAPVVIFLAAPESESARAYLQAIQSAEPEFRVWGGRPLVVVPAARAGAADAPVSEARPVPVVVDAGGEAWRRCGVDAEANAVIIADRWGQIYHVSTAADAGALPAPAEIVEWLRFIATQCPECGVPDEPGQGEWAR